MRQPLLANARRRRAKARTSDPLGLILLHEPEHGPVADLVFIHTLGGASLQSWMKEDEIECFWPREWLPREPSLSDVRISTFGYSLPAASPDELEALDFSGWAKELLLNLRFKTGREERPLNFGAVPLIFVSHGLGGLVAKKAYLLGRNNTNTDFSAITRSVAAFVFFATPHRGVHLVETLKEVIAAAVPGWSSMLEPSYLERHSQILHDINEKFKELLPYVDVVSFYENQPTMTGASLVFVLWRDKATIGHQIERPIELDADHVSITKFTSRRDANYIKVREVLRYLIEKFRMNIPETPLDNSEEEMARVSDFLGVDQSPEDDHSYFADKRVEGTCDFVLEHEAFKSWFENVAGKFDVLWCYGKAGTGKSVTTSHIIDHFKGAGLPCAYYYFRSGDQVKNNLTLFLLSIAFQIASFNAEYRRKLCRLADDGFNIGKAGYKMLWKRLFMSTLLKIHLKGPIHLVIDGLDELDVMMVKELISKMFVELSETNQPIRLLLVSRPIPDIESVVDRLARHLHPPNALRRMALNGNEADLELYVEEEMQSMFGDDAFKQDTAARVLQKADGNFLWVHLVVREILDCITVDDVENALTTVPQELNPLYSRMDQRLANTFRVKPELKQLGQTILTWACCSRYPILLEELSEALSPEFSRIIDIRQTVQKVCGEFVIVDKRHYLTMMHASARDFLLSQSGLNYHIQPDKTHQGLFRKCIQKLNDCHAQIRQIIGKARTFAKYAAESWPFHLTASCAWLDQDSLSALIEFFQAGAVIDWICILASAGRLRVLIDASKALTNFVKTVQIIDQARSPLQHRITDRECILSWAQDLVRIVGKFGAQMLQHPTAIYDLIPMFCPRNSTLYKQFAAETSGTTLRIRGALSSDWDDCLAKFAVPGQSLPQSITTLERHFAILTSDGIVRLFYSNTCEEARSFEHGEVVLALSFNVTGDHLATCGLHKTKIWDTRTARHLFTVENPQYTKTLTMCFKTSEENTEVLMSLSDDTLVRYCSMASAFFKWTVMGPCKVDIGSAHEQTNYPRNAQFSPDGSQVAITYRGAHPTVWSLSGERPVFVSQCESRTASDLAYTTTHVKNVDAQAFCWNPVSGHLLGTYNDGCVFKWHPTKDEYDLSDIRSSGIKCSADGKLFVTSSGNGMLRVWDFEHFTPIYQLSFPQGVSDVDIDRNEARIYDIRDMYCNTWQPNALLRLMESDDKVSDTKSSRDSSNQLSLASEGQQEVTEPITALTASGLHDSYAIGNDAGETFLLNYDGEELSTLAGSIMSVEHIACCKNRGVIAIADLGRDITVQHIPINTNPGQRGTSGIPFFSTSEPDSIIQMLFDNEGKMLLVVTTASLRIYDIDAKSLLGISIEPRNYYWITHPDDPSLLLGFGSDHMKVVPWRRLTEATICQYERPSDPRAAPFLRNESRRPSEAYPMSPSEIDAITEKVLVSPDCRYFLIQVRCSTNQATRRIDSFIVDLTNVRQATTTLRIPIRPLPISLTQHMKIALGFVAVDHSIISQSRRSSAPAVFNSRRAVPRPQLHEQTFAFIDQNFWVCTVNIGPIDGLNRPLRKHFFLPRDWQNAEWLELATIAMDGTFLCPRNGEVAAVSDGLAHEWRDD